MAVTRQIVLAIDPESGLTNTYSWGYAADANSDEEAITCAFAPKTKGSSINPQQETVFMGTKNAGVTFQAFRDDLTQDGASDFTAVAITNRLDPSLATEQISRSRRFTHLELPSINSWEEGLTIEFAKDVVNPRTDAVTWLDVIRNSGDSKATIPNGLARWIHLRIIDEGSMKVTPTFNAFTLYYYDLYSRQDADT